MSNLQYQPLLLPLSFRPRTQCQTPRSRNGRTGPNFCEQSPSKPPFSPFRNMDKSSSHVCPPCIIIVIQVCRKSIRFQSSNAFSCTRRHPSAPARTPHIHATQRIKACTPFLFPCIAILVPSRKSLSGPAHRSDHSKKDLE